MLMVGRHWKVEEFLELTWVLTLQGFAVVSSISDHPDLATPGALDLGPTVSLLETMWG